MMFHRQIIFPSRPSWTRWSRIFCILVLLKNDSAFVGGLRMARSGNSPTEQAALGFT